MAKRQAQKKKATKKKVRATPRRTRTSSSTPPPPPPQPPSNPEASTTSPIEDPTSWRTVNRSQIAELLGTHPDTVSDYTKDGMPVLERGGHGRESSYDAVACLNWWRQQQGKGAKEVAHTRALNAQAELSEQRARLQRKELRSRSAIVLAWQTVQKGWSIRLQSIPRRLVQLGVLSRENEKVAVDLIREILIDIANWRGVDDVADDESAPGATTDEPTSPASVVASLEPQPHGGALKRSKAIDGGDEDVT